jgi:hypothetical protein
MLNDRILLGTAFGGAIALAARPQSGGKMRRMISFHDMFYLQAYVFRR